MSLANCIKSTGLRSAGRVKVVKEEAARLKTENTLSEKDAELLAVQNELDSLLAARRELNDAVLKAVPALKEKYGLASEVAAVEKVLDDAGVTGKEYAKVLQQAHEGKLTAAQAAKAFPPVDVVAEPTKVEAAPPVETPVQAGEQKPVAPTKAEDAPDAKLSETPSIANPNTKHSLLNFIEGLFRSSERMSKVVKVYATQADAITDNPDIKLSEAKGRVAGFTTSDGRVGLIAEHIAKGDELGTILHEIGVHLGMEKLIGAANMKWLQGKVQLWSKLDDGSVEAEAAKAAVRRAEASSSANKDEELIAYMVEELINRGVNPTAFGAANVGQWFRRYIAAMKAALRKIGIKSANFSGQNLIDLAYGAAELEMSDSTGWHGTAADKEAVKFSEDVAPVKPVKYGSQYLYERGEKGAKKAGYASTRVEKQESGEVWVWRVKTKAPPGVKPQFSEQEPYTQNENAIRQTVVTVKDGAVKIKGYFDHLHALVERAEKLMPSARAWHDAILETKATKYAVERKAEAIAVLASRLKAAEFARVNHFVDLATTSQKWYRQPEWLGRTVVVDTHMEGVWNAMNPAEQAVADGMFEFNEAQYIAREKVFKDLGLESTFTSIARLDGPYSPKKRFGKHVGLLRSQDYVDAEDAAAQPDATAAEVLRVQTMRKDSRHYVSKGFSSSGAAETFAKQNLKKYPGAISFPGAARIDGARPPMEAALQKIVAAVDASTIDMPDTAKEAMREMVKDIYLSTVDQSSARQASRHRQNIAGADENMIKAFMEHAKSDANFIANVKHGVDVNAAFYAMTAERKLNDRAGAAEYNLIAAHYASLLKPATLVLPDTQEAVKTGTTVYLLSLSPGYHLTNATQTLNVTLPKLAADFGSGNYLEALGHITDGYKLMKHIGNWGGFDMDKIPEAAKPDQKNYGLKQALERAANLQLLTVGIEEDVGQFTRTQTHYAMIDGTTALASKMLHWLQQVSRTVEAWNRVSSGAAAYNMAIKHGRNHAQAQAYLLEVLNTTQGDTSRTDAPLIIKEISHVAPVAVQFRKYQLMIAALYTKAFGQIVNPNSTPEERAIGARFMVFKLAHALALGGVKGLPLYGIGALLFNALRGDDEPEDLDDTLEKNLPEFVYSGLPSAWFGWDMSAKLGDQNVFSPFPYMDFTVGDPGDLKTVAGGLVFGPSISVADKALGGAEMVARGQARLGVERTLPKGFESVLQSERMARAGYSLKNGDIVIPPEDISAFALALHAIGMPSSEVRAIARRQSARINVEKFFGDRESRIRSQYVAAFRADDTDEMDILRESWDVVQYGKDTARYMFNDDPEKLKVQDSSVLDDAVERAETRQEKSREMFEQD